MGTDNLFHKRKARSAKGLNRRKPKKEPYAKVLIVCEGEKTEPLYFQNLKDFYGLSSANIEICGDCGSAPNSIYAYAKQRYREAKDARDPFDHVFCVFDKDTHDSYEKTVADIARATPKHVYQAMTSVPCFEYWLILHFIYSTKPYNDLPKNTSCHQVCKDLKNYIPEYEKGLAGIFSQCFSQLEFAKSNAKRALQAAEQNSTENPSTHIHELVEFLQKIKQQSA